MKTIKEVSEYFHVHFRTVYKWIREGKISTVKIGGKHLITEEEFERIKKGI